MYTVSLFLNAFENPFAFMALIAGFAAVLVVWKREYSIPFFLSVALSFATGHILKVLFAVPRPLDALVALDSYRFPSFHAVIASTLLVSMWWYVVHSPERTLVHISATAVAVALIAFVSYTRLVLGVHEPIDVVVGCTIGTVVTLLVHYSFSRAV